MKTTLHILISLFFPSFLLISCTSISQTDLKNQCLDDQRSALLQLHHGLYYAPNFTFFSKAKFWNLNETDCCSWKGVTCNALGHVVGLDLSAKNLSGNFHSIFNLHHLQQLNLAGNNFNTTMFSYGFGKLSNLTHLNLSSSCFHGQIPMEISCLTRLVSLDLSYQDSCFWRNPSVDPYDDDYPTLKLEKPNFKTLIKNLRSLMELYLDGVNISSQSSKWCESISSTLPNLRVLSMSDCGLKGPFCSSLLRLPFLSKLLLADNLISYLPPNFLEVSSPLVSLNLENCNLSGQFPTEFFLLPKIQSIDISYNHNLMGQLPEFPINNTLRLTDLTLSDCSFSGAIPSSIANLTSLVNLDLSFNNFSGLIPQFHRSGVPNLASLHLYRNMLSGSIHSSLFTLPSLHTLFLGGNQLVGEIGEFPNASSSLIEVLNLNRNYLRGSIPKSILQLPRLERLYIGYNNFDSLKLDMFFQLKNIRGLHLSNISLSIENHNKSLVFPQLDELYLDSCDLTEFPEFIKAQDKLAFLDLSNNRIQGFVPSWLWKTSLEELDLSLNSIYFPKQFSFGDVNSSFPMLRFLSLKSCNISTFPSFLKSQENLEYLDLSNNKISGAIQGFDTNSSFPMLRELTLKSCNISTFPSFLKSLENLEYLDLSNNNISGAIQGFDTNSSFPMLRELTLTSCNISTFPSFLKSQENLEYLDLSNNNISGAIPNWVWKKSLQSLNLSNNFLSSLDQFLPNQSLTSSQGSLERSICNLSQLWLLDASYNKLSGPISSCLGNITTLEYLDLQQNNFSGSIPDFAKATQLSTLRLSDNKLEGKLPRSLVNCIMLQFLDLGNNTIYDTFPQWLGKLPALIVLILRGNKFYGPIKVSKNNFPALDVLDIASNNFSGQLSVEFFQGTQLRSLKIGGNKLEGRLPRSLANCTKLEVLDLGKNMIHDTFPFWLEKLPSLKVLILRGNGFYGTIKFSEDKNSFPMVRILDLASNNFSGELSIAFFQSLKAMMKMTDGNKAKPDYIGDKYYRDSVTIVNKGFEIVYTKILTIFACLDLSDNSFHGRIPEEIQNLKPLKVLNLSHNSFFGTIPLALGNLTELESLDLSHNKLSGEIPLQLTSLTFLAVLNLSYNQLEGSIPQTNQFGTFLNDSYQGNPRLCGPPLTKKCHEVGPGKPPQKEDVDSLVDGLSDWKIVLIGYGCGLVIGLCIGYTVLNEMGNRWLNSYKRNGKRNPRRSRNFLTLPPSEKSPTSSAFSRECFYALDTTKFGFLNCPHPNPIEHGFDLQNMNIVSGKIPPQLARLTFLEALNLSYNQLEGNIPQSNQFMTFSNDSYRGNPRLCGLPLSRKCNEVVPGRPPPKEYVDSLLDGFSDWRIVLIGYGCGLVIGLCIGYTVLNEWGNKLLDSFTFNGNRKWRRST
ncbi:hypothetical protein REPUB_Repub15cG0084900 [Reevesia pubescens]